MALYFSPFLNTGVTCASFQASGVLACFSDARYNLVATRAIHCYTFHELSKMISFTFYILGNLFCPDQRIL